MSKNLVSEILFFDKTNTVHCAILEKERKILLNALCKVLRPNWLHYCEMTGNTRNIDCRLGILIADDIYF